MTEKLNNGNEYEIAPPVRYEREIASASPFLRRTANGRFVPNTVRDKNAAARALMDLGWTFEEVAAVFDYMKAY